MQEPSEPSIDHHIQLHILKEMLTRVEARYSELKPPAVEANLFMYHLNQLIKVGLIIKKEKAYVLTRAGKHFADRAYLGSMKIRLQPKSITILAIQNTSDKWLILKRMHQPFINYKGFPSGKIHYGEKLLESAERELLEKSGLSNVPIELKGNIVMRFMDEAAAVNHILGYVFYGRVTDDREVDYEREHFRSYFAPESEFFSPPHFEGHQQIFELLKGPYPFIAEHDFKSAY